MSTHPVLGARQVTDGAGVEKQLEKVAAGGRTALYDATYAGLALAIKQPVGRTLVLVFSDGVDNSSWLTEEQLLEAMKRSNAVVYCVGREDTRSQLEKIADATGGQFFAANADKHLAVAFVRVLDLFRAADLLTYSPEGVKRGDGWHTLKVQLARGKGRVLARAGYNAR